MDGELLGGFGNETFGSGAVFHDEISGVGRAALRGGRIIRGGAKLGAVHGAGHDAVYIIVVKCLRQLQIGEIRQCGLNSLPIGGGIMLTVKDQILHIETL